jgi:hypothetical protein
MKWREKNRFRVGCETDGPPQIQIVRSFPIKGIAVTTPVITVAPQSDICPHGRTYPKKPVAIVSSMRRIPVDHTIGFLLGEEKYKPRAVWVYNRMKNKDAPFM